MDELKRCPFCGGRASMFYREGRHGLFGYVQCEECEAKTRTKTVYGEPDNPKFWEQAPYYELATIWNKRVTASA